MSDGVDMTRAADTGNDPARKGEPDEELGLIRQKDAAWKDQTGAPADPQAGNIAGGKRDVLRSASFNTGAADGFVPDSLGDLFHEPPSGDWTLAGGRYGGTAASGGAAIDLLTLDVAPASYAQLTGTLSTAAQGGFVFDYYGPEDSKFAALSVETHQILPGHRTAKAGRVIDAALTNATLDSTTDYVLEVTLKGTTVCVTLDGQAHLAQESSRSPSRQ